MFSLLPPHIGKRDVSHVIARPTGRGNIKHNHIKDCHVAIVLAMTDECTLVYNYQIRYNSGIQKSA